MSRMFFIVAKVVAIIGMMVAVIGAITETIGNDEQAIMYITTFGLLVIAELWQINQKIDDIVEEASKHDVGTGGGEQT